MIGSKRFMGIGRILGQEMVPGPAEEVPIRDSWIRVSVWDAKENKVISGAKVSVRRADGADMSVEGATGKIGVARMRLPGWGVGARVNVTVSAAGFREKTVSSRTVTETEAGEAGIGLMVDLERGGIETGTLVALAGLGIAGWWLLS